MACDGDDAALLRVLEVAMTAPRACQIPAVGLQHLDCVADFHFVAAYKRTCPQSTRLRPNENKMSHGERERTWQRIGGLKS